VAAIVKDIVARTGMTSSSILGIYRDHFQDDDFDLSPPCPQQQQQQQQQPPPSSPVVSSSRSKGFWCAALWYHFGTNWKALVLGQVLSVLLAGQGAVQATLYLKCDLSAPTFTVGVTYLFLSFHLIVVWRQSQRIVLRHQRLNQEGEKEDVALEDCNDNDDDDHDHDDGDHSGDDDADSKQEPINDSRTEFFSIWEPSSSSSLLTSSYTFFHLFPLHRPWYVYLIMAFLDIESNYVTVLAFRYTTLTSVTLFTALSIPSAMIVSKIFLGRQYTWLHLLGAVTCMTGVVFNVLQDYESDSEMNTTVSWKGTNTTTTTTNNSNTSLLDATAAYPHKLTGDLLAILGGLLYGLNDVLTEVCVQHNGGTSEYLGVVGFFAFGIAIVQGVLVEWDDIAEFFGRSISDGLGGADEEPHQQSSSTCPLWMGWSLYGSFVGLGVMAYAGGSHLLIISEAAFFNLSLLTGNLWSVGFSVVAERIVPQPLFFVALVFVVSGVVIYEMAPSPVARGGDKGRDHDSELSLPCGVRIVPPHDRLGLSDEDQFELATTDRTTSLT
jgi:solute carrier family 35, member F1/2